MIGIYKITNKTNNHMYVGCSTDIESRWKQHKRKAFNAKSKEYEKPLYRAIRKYGINQFDFQIIEECSIEQLFDREMYYIDVLDTYRHGYNQTPGGEGQQDIVAENHPKTHLTNTDVYYIREAYNNHCDQVTIFEKYKNKVGLSGFKKIWNGDSWKTIHMDVYTKENKAYYLFRRNSHVDNNPKAKLCPEDVRNIRNRKRQGEQPRDVWKDYQNITYGSFLNVWSNQNWKSIT